MILLKLSVKHIFTKTNTLCSLDDESRKKLCAEVAKACYTELEKVDLEDILKVLNKPTECEKYQFITPLLKKQACWSKKKRMFICKPFTVNEIPIADFFLSAAGIRNAVMVFSQPRENSKIIQLTRLVKDLSYQEEIAESKEGKEQNKTNFART